MFHCLGRGKKQYFHSPENPSKRSFLYILCPLGSAGVLQTYGLRKKPNIAGRMGLLAASDWARDF